MTGKHGHPPNIEGYYKVLSSEVFQGEPEGNHGCCNDQSTK